MDHKTLRKTKTSVYLPGAGSRTCAGARPKEQVACLPGAGVQRKSICVYLVQDQGQVCTWCKARTGVFPWCKFKNIKHVYLLQGQGQVCLPGSGPSTRLFAWRKFRD